MYIFSCRLFFNAKLSLSPLSPRVSLVHPVIVLPAAARYVAIEMIDSQEKDVSLNQSLELEFQLQVFGFFF